MMTTPTSTHSTDTRHHVVIVGGGFAGLNAAKTLGKQSHVRVTLIDKRNFHLFQPLLYQVATGALAPSEIASPLRYVLKKYKNVQVLQAEVTGLDAHAHALHLADSETPFTFDSLIVATGSNHHYFGKDEWSSIAPGLKTLEDALTMRRNILSAFERAEKTTCQQEREALLTFMVVGAGPTGVELAGSIADMAQQVLKNEFKNINPADAKILIAEGTDRALPVFSANLSASAKQALEQLNVKLYTNTFVTGVSETSATLKTPEGEVVIPTHTILWGAGVMGNKLGKLIADALGVETDRMARVMVEADLSIPKHPNMYVVGDLAHFAHTPNQQPLPGVAPVAMQQGVHVAKVILAKLANQPAPAFSYWDKGSMAIIGNNRAVAKTAGLEFDGFLAWMMWLVVHVAFLMEFDNRLLVLLNWCITYVWRKRPARLIVN